MASIIMAALACIVMLAGSGTARAQCTTVTVNNTAACSVNLCLYDITGTTPQECWFIPNNGPVRITFPAGFSPDGVVSNAGKRYAFDAAGCSVCYTQTTVTPVVCCATVCYDASTCTITIAPCTQTVCYP
jgi:hypothetical protein